MERRPLGRTGLTVSALGFGCGAVGGLMVRGEPAAQTRAVARALEAGIRYFDTAPSYGDGRSEASLGRVLGELQPREVVVGTKFRLDAGDEADAGGAVRRSLEASLRRLRLERVDLLQLHNRIGRPDGLAPDLVLGPVVEALGRLREDGLIGHFGVTATGETAALHRVVSSGRIATAQCYFNALNPSAGWAGRSGGGQDFGGLIDRAAAAGVGVIVIRPLAAGAVAGGGPRHTNAGGAGGAIAGTTFEQDAAGAAALADLAGALGLEGPVELALRLALAKPGVSTVIVGYSDQAQLEEAIRYAERGALPDGAVARVLDRAAG